MTIQIQDRLSQPMRAMLTAVSMMVNQMEAMHTASGSMMDTSSIEIARRELASAADEFNRMEDEVRNAGDAQRGFNNNIRDGTTAADGLLSKIIGIAAAYLSFQTGKNIVDLSDEMINTQARLELMNGTYHKNAEAAGSINNMLMTTAELQDMIFDSVQRTFTSYQSTADMVGKLGMQASGAFANTTEIIAFAEQINKTFSIAGTSVEGVNSVMLQLTQAMAAGRLQGEELNAILDNAQPFVANIQRYLEEAMNIYASRGSGNMKSIGVEICYSKSDGARYEIAEENAVQYIAKLLKEYGWGIDRVKQHYDWFKKNCPHRIRAEGRWNSFLKRIEQAMEPTMPTQPKEEPQVTNTLTSTAKEDLRGY